MQIIGVVLWWDQRDGNGIIRDIDGTKYYFDTSVLAPSFLKNGKIKSGLPVRFEVNKDIKDCLCAYRVAPANLKQKAKIERVLEEQRQLDLF